jgi:endonuclease YncB( thermonuclease family)
MRTLAAVILAITFAAMPAGAQQPIQAYVTRVVDGDTIYVIIGGRMESVRYIGINTPETHHPTRGREPGGEAATEANRRLVDGRWVTLVLDVQQRDRYGRLLAYVWVGERFVNAELVHQGYAQAATYPPNVKHADYFVKLERGARESRRGLWKGAPPAAGSAAPSARVPGDSARESVAPRFKSPETDTSGSAVVPSLPLPPSYSPQPSYSSQEPAQTRDQRVRGYRRQDGQWVEPYLRSGPDR